MNREKSNGDFIHFGFSAYGIHDRIKLFFSIFLAIAIVDQSSKLLVLKFIHEPIIIIPKLLSLTFIENTGAAFGMFQNKSLILGIINIMVIGIIILLNFKLKLPIYEYVPLGLIAGGALGNAIDRLFFSSVIDFIDVFFWPIFNLADVSIVLGFIWLFIVIFFYDT